MVLGVLQMICASRIAPAYGAFLEMALQDVASAEGIFAKMARVRTLSSVWILLVDVWWRAMRCAYGEVNDA